MTPETKDPQPKRAAEAAAIAAKLIADEAEDRRLERMTHDELCQVEIELLADHPELAA